MNILGLDPSLTSTGICAGDNHGVAYQSREEDAARLVDIRDYVLRMCLENDVKCVIMEGYSYGSRTRAHALGELGGVLKVAFNEAWIPYVLVPPTSRAKFATGRGNAGKAEVISAVSFKTNRSWSGKGIEDRIDAWVLHEMGLEYLGQSQYEWPAENRKALDGINWEPLLMMIGVENGEPITTD
jgi:Holliday junction resolvasome RuvABC endonuclease subunit